MRRRTGFCLATAAFFLAGCVQPLIVSDQPLVAPKPLTLQSSGNTVRDWNDVAHEITLEMTSLGLLPTAATPVFVRVLAPDSAFLREVAEKLTGDILDAGGTIARDPGSATTVVNLDVDVVQWSFGPRPFSLMPNVEAVWKATILTNDRMVANLTQPVYIWQGDIPLYAAEASQPMSTRPLRYDP